MRGLLDKPTLRQARVRARQLRQQLDQVLFTADSRLALPALGVQHVSKATAFRLGTPARGMAWPARTIRRGVCAQRDTVRGRGEAVPRLPSGRGLPSAKCATRAKRTLRRLASRLRSLASKALSCPSRSSCPRVQPTACTVITLCVWPYPPRPNAPSTFLHV